VTKVYPFGSVLLSPCARTGYAVGTRRMDEVIADLPAAHRAAVKHRASA